MTVKELNELLNERFSPALSCEWDNDGLQVTPDPGATVTGVLLALDLSDAAIECAKDSGCNVILTHHPLLFRPLSELTPESGVGRRVQRLLSLGISAIACHTRADAAPGGLNDALAERMGLSDVTPFADGIPRIGTFRHAAGRKMDKTDYVGVPGLLHRGGACQDGHLARPLRSNRAFPVRMVPLSPRRTHKTVARGKTVAQ